MAPHGVWHQLAGLAPTYPALGIHVGIECTVTNGGPTRPISPPLERVHYG